MTTSVLDLVERNTRNYDTQNRDRFKRRFVDNKLARKARLQNKRDRQRFTDDADDSDY